MRKRIRRKEGMTLVEVVVSLLLMSILMAMVVGVVSPAAKTFTRMQRVQFAYLILDNVEDEIKAQLQDAVGSIKIYDVADGGSVAGKAGSSSGAVLEYVNTDSYVVLMSADGCAQTTLVKNGVAGGTDSADTGRLLLRYYWQETTAGGGGASSYQYNYQDASGSLVARAVQQVFSNKFYMGNYLKLNFSFPDSAAAGSPVDYIKVNLKLYRDEACTDLLAEEDYVAELRYKATRLDAATAVAST